MVAMIPTATIPHPETAVMPRSLHRVADEARVSSLAREARVALRGRPMKGVTDAMVQVMHADWCQYLRRKQRR